MSESQVDQPEIQGRMSSIVLPAHCRQQLATAQSPKPPPTSHSHSPNTPQPNDKEQDTPKWNSPYPLLKRKNLHV